jgi:hypothetical protein
MGCSSRLGAIHFNIVYKCLAPFPAAPRYHWPGKPIYKAPTTINTKAATWEAYSPPSRKDMGARNYLLLVQNSFGLYSDGKGILSLGVTCLIGNQMSACDSRPRKKKWSDELSSRFIFSSWQKDQHCKILKVS